MHWKNSFWPKFITVITLVSYFHFLINKSLINLISILIFSSFLLISINYFKRVINQFLYSLTQNVNYLFLFTSFIATDHDHASIAVITFTIAQFLKGMLFKAIIFEMISYLDLENHHLFRLLVSSLLLYHQYHLLSILFQKAYSKEG